jgi:hypothetical protein
LGEASRQQRSEAFIAGKGALEDLGGAEPDSHCFLREAGVDIRRACGLLRRLLRRVGVHPEAEGGGARQRG